ncbi:hypothetical protein ASPCAL02938 [Aspergillus calidoustus]|uniref:GPI anchored protein n=1 Tax=Aspergillus calidoustus TaxID=454130 RepID=A0A0U5GRN0_ASPCI|nr:hypothetical protein ASPCAL02938 [Aspergillus calidoustus]
MTQIYKLTLSTSSLILVGLASKGILRPQVALDIKDHHRSILDSPSNQPDSFLLTQTNPQAHSRTRTMYSNMLLLGFSILTGALAADQVVTMYLPDNDDAQALAGRVLGSQSDTTTYLIACADSVTTTCDLPAAATVIQAPSTVSLIADVSGEPVVVACTHDDEIATCSMGAGEVWYVTDTESVTSYGVTITGTGTPSSGSTPASSSATHTSTTPTSSATQADSSQSSTNTTTGAGAQQTDDDDNGAVTRISGVGLGAALMAIGAAAVALL